jgi:ABC-type Zn uptake system ZnuABC Zn-binding protein ZnuA
LKTFGLKLEAVTALPAFELPCCRYETAVFRINVGRRMMKAGLVIVALLLTAGGATADPVRIGVSDGIYADLARQLGETGVAVTSTKPGKTTGSSTRAFPTSDIVVCSGTKADAWLCDSARQAAPPPVVLEAVALTANQQAEPAFPGYDTKTMLALARQLAAELSRRLPAEAPRIAASLTRIETGVRNIDRKIEEIAHGYERADVIVADQLSRNFADQLHFKVQNEASLRGLRHGAAPSAAAVAAWNDAVQRRKASILLYDQDAATPAVKELVAAANDTGMPVVGLRENLPSGLHYQQWMLRQLNAVHGALNEAAP